MLDGHTTVHQIVDAVCGEFDVAADQAAADLTQFLATLESSGVAQATGANG
jgi:hypothetical protein